MWVEEDIRAGAKGIIIVIHHTIIALDPAFFIILKSPPIEKRSHHSSILVADFFLGGMALLKLTTVQLSSSRIGKSQILFQGRKHVVRKVGGDGDWRRLRREMAGEGNIGLVKEKDDRDEKGGKHVGESKRN